MPRRSIHLKNNSLQLGAVGEQMASDFLEKKGYLIQDRNYRCKQGEIDIIATHKEYLVFIEVKSRLASKYQVDPFLSITKAKRDKLRLLGEIYLLRKKIWDKQPRFDVIGITFQDKTKRSIKHIEGAF